MYICSLVGKNLTNEEFLWWEKENLRNPKPDLTLNKARLQ